MDTITIASDNYIHLDVAAEHLREYDMFLINTPTGELRFVEVESVSFEYSDHQVQVITDGGVVRFYDDERVFVTRPRV